MDVYKALSELHEEKKRLDAVIAFLEAKTKMKVTTPAAGGKRRGRKSMGIEERRAVSERMAAYWAARRASQGSSGGETQAANNGSGS